MVKKIESFRHYSDLTFEAMRNLVCFLNCKFATVAAADSDFSPGRLAAVGGGFFSGHRRPPDKLVKRKRTKSAFEESNDKGLEYVDQDHQSPMGPQYG